METTGQFITSWVYTLDNYNTGFMPAYSFDKDYVIVKADGEFQPIHGIEEITLDQTSNPIRNNGNKLFYYQKSVGFINNYSNDLYLIQEDGIQNLVSFEFNGVKFQPKEYIKNADGIRFLKTLENGFSFVSDLSITNSHIVETISVSSENPSRKYDDIYLFYDMESKDYKMYSGLEDNTGTFGLHRIYLFDQPFDYEAYAVIQPKPIEEMEETNHPRRQMILDMLEQNNNNPILALLKFK